MTVGVCGGGVRWVREPRTLRPLSSLGRSSDMAAFPSQDQWPCTSGSVLSDSSPLSSLWVCVGGYVCVGVSVGAGGVAWGDMCGAMGYTVGNCGALWGLHFVPPLSPRGLWSLCCHLVTSIRLIIIHAPPIESAFGKNKEQVGARHDPMHRSGPTTIPIFTPSKGGK